MIYAATHDNNFPGEVKISSKNCWPLPVVGHITQTWSDLVFCELIRKMKSFNFQFFDSLCNIQIILSKMFQILTIHDI